MARMSIPHYAWAAGHGLVLLTSIYALLGIVTRSPHPYAYRLAYLGATGEYACKSLCCMA